MCITFGLTTLNCVTRLLWEQDLNRFLSGAVIPYYFGYFVLGHLLKSRELTIPGGKPALALIFLSCTGLTALGEFTAMGANTMLPTTFFNYQQPLTVLMAGSIFLFFKGWKPAPNQKRAWLVHELSGLTYGIFLSHILVLMLLTGPDIAVLQPWGRAQLVQRAPLGGASSHRLGHIRGFCPAHGRAQARARPEQDRPLTLADRVRAGFLARPV